MTAGEIWTLELTDKKASAFAQTVAYATKFGDTLSDIAFELGSKLNLAKYDVVVRGRVLTISNATVDLGMDIAALVKVGLEDKAKSATPVAGATGTAAIVPQLRFTPDSSNVGVADPGEWNVAQTVYVMAIDDKVIDGGDALVFPEFDERVNAIRGPLTIVGGSLVGAERFLNDPFRLPEETNDPQADGTVNAISVDNSGNGVMNDREAYHLNAIYGERPGFDPRMNQFPSSSPGSTVRPQALSRREVGFPGNPVGRPRRAVRRQAPDRQFRPGTTNVRFSGTPEQAPTGVGPTTFKASGDLKWLEPVVTLGGAASTGEDWTLQIDFDGGATVDAAVPYHVNADGRALSKIVRNGPPVSTTTTSAAASLPDIPSPPRRRSISPATRRSA